MTAEQLNVRDAPGTSAAVVGRIFKGDAVVVLGQNGDWLEIVAGGQSAQAQRGWVHARYVSLSTTGQQNRTQVPAPQATAALPRPLSVRVSDFSCNEGLLDEGYESCDVDLDVQIALPAIYAPFAADIIYLECEATVDYRTADGLMSLSESGTATTDVFLGGGFGDATVSIRITFTSFMDPVVWARLAEASCLPD